MNKISAKDYILKRKCEMLNELNWWQRFLIDDNELLWEALCEYLDEQHTAKEEQK